MLTERTAAALADVRAEREAQPSFDDSENTQGTWVCYIANYAIRWSMPYVFDKDRYTFRACMVKVAALAVAAIEWIDDCDGAACTLDATQAEKVADSIR